MELKETAHIHLKLMYREETARQHTLCFNSVYEAERQKVTAISELQLIAYQLEREKSRRRGRGTER